MNYAELNFESFKPHRNVPDFQKNLPSHSPSTLLISSAAGWKTAAEKRKEREDVLRKIFSLIFYTCNGGRRKKRSFSFNL